MAARNTQEPNILFAKHAPPRGPKLDRVLTGLLEISNFVGSVMLLDDILMRIVNITSDILDIPVCSIYLFDESHQRLVLRSNVGFEPELIGKASFKLGQGIVGRVAVSGQIATLPDATADPQYEPLPSAFERGYRAYMCAPLRIQEEVVGVMTARKKEVHQFTLEEAMFFETVCKQVAIVIEKSRMHEQKMAAERLAAVAVSLTGVAHYIKNVLLTMRGGEYLVDQGLVREDLQRAREGWDVLKRANGKIRSLVENILNYCRKSEIDTHPVNLNGMIDEMVQSLQELANERGVRLTTYLDPQLGDVWVDPESFYDALLNLVSNAIEAIPEEQTDGYVKVKTRKLQGRNQARINIVDNGPGIPDDIRDKIFNLFFSTKGQKGTGIGLAATRKIIEEHGGTIELKREKIQGAHFAIYLPIQPVEKPAS